MEDYINLMATTPHGEPCVQVGIINYMALSQIEAYAYIAQLKRVLGENPPGTRFKLIRCPHDAGTYLDIQFFYNEENDEHINYMNDVESGCEKWDEQALAELRSANYMLVPEGLIRELEKDSTPVMYIQKGA